MYYNEEEYKYLKEKNKREEPLGKIFLIILICCLFPPIIILYPLYMIISNILPNNKYNITITLGLIFFIILSCLIILLLNHPL